jgi:hypothetical protein
VAGTATAVSNRVSRRQYGRWERQAQEQASQQQAPAADVRPAPAAPAEESMDQKIAQLKQFAELHDAGVLTDEEFAAQKAKLLG